MGLAVLITSQVGRSMNDRKSKIPTKHDGKGSGRIEENTDVLLALYNHDTYVKQGEAEPMPDVFPEGTVLIRCLKHRNLGEAENNAVQPKFIGGIGVRD